MAKITTTNLQTAIHKICIIQDHVHSPDIVWEKDLSDSDPLSDSCLFLCDGNDGVMTESWPLLGDDTAEIGVDDLVGVMVLSADSNDSSVYLSLGESFFKVSSLDGSVMV